VAVHSAALQHTVVRPAWDFLKTKVLDEDPRYQVYAYQKP
jgi:hypothetical protein